MSNALEAAQAAFDAKQTACDTAKRLRKENARSLEDLAVLMRSEQTHALELRAARVVLYRAMDEAGL